MICKIQPGSSCLWASNKSQQVEVDCQLWWRTLPGVCHLDMVHVPTTLILHKPHACSMVIAEILGLCYGSWCIVSKHLPYINKLLAHKYGQQIVNATSLSVEDSIKISASSKPAPHSMVHVCQLGIRPTHLPHGINSTDRLMRSTVIFLTCNIWPCLFA